MSVCIGLDIGGTKIMAAAINEAGEMSVPLTRATPLDLQEGLDLLHQLIEEVCDQQPVRAIGAAIGGPLDWQTGVVSPLHQPQWRNIALKSIMEARWQCPFAVDVDTNVAALGEYHLSGETADRFLYITLSTGCGGGFIVDGKIYRGAGGAHPEIAHQSIAFHCAHPERVQCECGAPDCLEALISGNGIRRIYQKPAEELNDNEWDEVTYNLGLGLRNLAAIYLPGVISLGGGVAFGRGARLLQTAGEVMRSRLKIVPAPTLRLSRLGYDAALRGALWLAQNGTDHPDLL